MEFVDSFTAAHAATVQNPVQPANSGGRPGEAPAPVPLSTDARATQASTSEGGQPTWRVQCGDLINRDRCVTVFVENDQVVVVGPPGESARLTAGQASQLKAALNEAAKLAER